MLSGPFLPKEGDTMAKDNNQNLGVAWFDKIQGNIASAVLGNSLAIAQRATGLTSSLELATASNSALEKIGAMQTVTHAQEIADRISGVLEEEQRQQLNMVGVLRPGMVVGMDPTNWQQITGLKTSIDAVAKLDMPMANISALTEVGRITPPKGMIDEIGITRIGQSVTDAQTRMMAVPRGLAPAIEQATKHLTASQQLLKQMQNVSAGMPVALEGAAVALPDFEKFAAASRIVGGHFNKNKVDNVLRRFEQLEKELNLDIPVKATDDIDDLVEDAKAVEFVESQIIEDGILKPSISQALLGFNLSDLTLTQSGTLVAFGGSVATYLHYVLGELLDENITAARFLTIAIVYFLPVYGAAMAADGALNNGQDSPAA